MIICHCNVIDSDQIRSAVRQALGEMPAHAITPAHVYARCETAPNCGGCQLMIRHVIDSVVAETGAGGNVVTPNQAVNSPLRESA